MKRRARERSPKREAGAFPQYLYKTLDELVGSWGDPPLDRWLDEQSYAFHRKPLLLLTDEEIAQALNWRIGVPWLQTLVMIRLRQDPLRAGEYGFAGSLLASALKLPRDKWGATASELTAIANTFVPTLDPGDFETDPFLHDAHKAFVG